MFMAGAQTTENPNGSKRDDPIPELRVAGIKGCMRFIWRAVQRAGDASALREAEGRLFGNAFGGKDTKQSDMRMRIENACVDTGAEVMTPHRSLGGYDGKGKAFRAQALKSGGTFDAVISSFGEVETHNNFVRLFALTCLLYGFGRRSRKGFGTVAITGIDGAGGDIDPTFIGAVDNLNALALPEFGAKYSLQSNGAEIRVVGAETVAEYPYIENIKIAGSGSRHFDDAKDIIGQIGMAVHYYAGDAFLGLLRPRFASNVLLSTVPWDNGAYRCIVTQLHCTKRSLPTERNDLQKRKDFYRELNGRV
jgi:CRISPR-associated protein Cmr1